MRMFVAVLPPEPVVEDLDEFLAPRREDPAGGGVFRWTLPEQWHLTLAFAGQVPERAYDDIVDRLGRAAAKRRPVEARVAGGGAFPDPGRARVLYAGIVAGADHGTSPTGPPGGVSDAEELRRMSVGVGAALAKAGAEVAGQRFHPHLTLARLRQPVEATRWVRLLEPYAGPSWRVEEIALIASHLGEGPRRRPRYEVVETFSLGRAGSGPAPPDAPRHGR